MPIIDEEQLRSLLVNGQIGALTVDTNIIDEKGGDFNSPLLLALSSLKKRPFPFILSSTVSQEVLRHLEKAAGDAIRGASKSIGHALFAFDTKQPTRDELIEQITGGRQPHQAARDRFDKFIGDTGCEVIDDPKLVVSSDVLDRYFGERPPFRSGRKKSEFPDAYALLALERTATDRDVGILTVSKDSDWADYCDESKNLYLVQSIERALDLINNAPLELRTTLLSWLGEGGVGRDELLLFLADRVERMDFSAIAHPRQGDVETMTWAASLEEIDWPADNDIDIIRIEMTGEDSQKVTLSLPVTLYVEVPVELSFSVWDSTDRDSISMGGRTIEVNEELYVRLTITAEVFEHGSDDELVAYINGDLDLQFHEIDLGEVDIFEQED